MKVLLNKIPLIFWVFLLAALASFIVKVDYLSFLSLNQIRLLSSFYALIGLVFVAVQIQYQRKNQLVSTEYLNQPNFKIVGYNMDEIKGASPKLCADKNTCLDDHWFDIIQIGNLPAKKVKLCFYHKEEDQDIRFENKNRWAFHEVLIKGERQQYKLKQFTIPFKHFTPNEKGVFFISLEYDSSYSNIKYKKIYCIYYYSTKNNDSNNDWKDKIYYYNYKLVNATDSQSLKLKELLKGNWLKLLRFLKIKKDYSDDDWVITY